LTIIDDFQEGEELNGRFPTLEGKYPGFPLTMPMFPLNSVARSDGSTITSNVQENSVGRRLQWMQCRHRFDLFCDLGLEHGDLVPRLAEIQSVYGYLFLEFAYLICLELQEASGAAFRRGRDDKKSDRLVIGMLSKKKICDMSISLFVPENCQSIQENSF
jgi:hypothetical protein